jgi:hypothetical protein
MQTASPPHPQLLQCLAYGRCHMTMGGSDDSSGQRAFLSQHSNRASWWRSLASLLQGRFLEARALHEH